MADDPFPRERVAETLHRLPAYLRLAWRLARDPLISKARRATVVAAAGYLVSPVDLVPGFIPVVGQLDDIAFAIAALKVALSGLDPVRRQEHLASVGLADDDLARDLRTLGATSAWMVRAGARTTGRVARQGGKAAAAGASAAARAAPAVKTVVVKAAPAAKATAAAAGTAAGRAVPAAKAAAERVSPAAKAAAAKVQPAAKAASKAGSGAKSAAAKGIAAARGLAGKQPGAKVRVTVRRPIALGPGRDAGASQADAERLDVEPDRGG
jgi:uncharacterized membrane protein YkvA (DUF1232 family)